jgi:hypothetical protein
VPTPDGAYALIEGVEFEAEALNQIVTVRRRLRGSVVQFVCTSLVS